MRLIVASFIFLLTLPAQAETPWGEVDLAAAPALHEKSCVACHRRMYGGDGSKMYTRDGRVLSNQLELQQRVASCNATMSAGWFPDEENSVAAWLNQRYYFFEK